MKLFNCILCFIILISTGFTIFSQTLIINEISQGPTGNQEYIELAVVDTQAVYQCGNSAPPTIDIRGWIVDDNSGYHGAAGIAAGAVRFSNNALWQNVPLGTIILIYNGAQPNTDLPPIDSLFSDNNCRIVLPIENTSFFESNATTPGAVACSYPSTGWLSGGNWNNIILANGGDCARIVDLNGCEVFSVCWGTANTNTSLYFAGSAQDRVYFLNNGTPTVQANWSNECADNETVLDAGSCGANFQTPGLPNNLANSLFLAQFNNYCTPIQPLSLSLTSTTNQSCTCDGSATISASGSIGPYTFVWYDNFNLPLGQTTATASNLCTGNYYCVVTSSINCIDTINVFIGSNCASFGTFASATMIENCVINQFYNTTWGSLPDQINPSGVLFDNYDYGPYFQNSATLILRGGEVKTYKNPGANVCGAKLYYTVYTVGNQPANPVYTILDLPFKESCTVGPNSFPTGGPCFNASDQKWAKENYNIDLTTYPPGDYVLEVYYAVPGSFTSTTTCNDTIYVNNNGNNYKALFQIKPQPLISGGPLTICPGNNSTLTSNFTSGNSWSNSSTNQSITVNNGGTYTLTVNLNNNCPNLSDTESITAYSAPTVEAGDNQSTCGTNSITLNGTIGGSSTGSVWISPSGTFSNPNSLTTTFTPTVSSGIATVILSASGPCPTVQDQLIVIINATPTVNAGNDQTICAGQSVNLSGSLGGSAGSGLWSAPSGSFSNSSSLTSTYTPSISSGSITLTLSASGPCPVVTDQIIINITAQTVPSFTQVPSICSGGSFTLPTTSNNGITGTWSPANNNTATTTYTFTPTAGQCATLTNMTIFVSQIYNVNVSNTICPSQIPYVWNGITFNGPGTQSATLNSVNNCDSIVNMTVNVSTTITSNTNLNICPSDLPFTWNGLIFNSAGTQSAILTATSGCDSIATLNLLVFEPLSSTSNSTVCQSQIPYSWNGLTFNGPGTQTTTLQDVNGCDSLATLTLQVANTLSSSTSLSVCPSELPFSWNGLSFSGAGTQTTTLLSAGGCDSLVTLTLSLNPTYNEMETISICSNETPYLWNGLSLSSSTTQSVTLNSIDGCDSIVTLNLSVLPTFTTSLDSIICQNEMPLIWNGLTFNSSEVQSLNLSSVNGCDSIVIMNVQVLQPPQILISGGGVFCEGDFIQPVEAILVGSSPFNISYTIDGFGNNLSSNQNTISLGNTVGNYDVIEISDQNCQVISNLGSASIVINPIPSSPQVSNDSTYCLNASPDSLIAFGNINSLITWFSDLDLSNPIQTGNSYYPDNILGQTTYYVIQENNGCASPSNEIIITFEICDIIIPTAFTPDGDNTNDYWNLGNIDAIYPNNLVTIYNRWGNIIYQSQRGKYELKPWDGTHNQEPMPVGSYYFIIEFGETFKGNESGIVSIVK